MTGFYPNKFVKNCNNPACRQKVEIGAGYIQKVNNNWLTWCKKCVPAQITPKETPQRLLTSDGRIIVPYEPNNLPLIKSLKGPNGSPWPKWDNDNKAWLISLEEADRPRLLEVAERLKLEIAPNLRNYTLSVQAEAAQIAGLYPYQVDGVHWLSKGNKRLLGDDMGLGKSVQVLMALPKGAKVLVVGPAGLRYNWKGEAAKWRSDINVTIPKNKASFQMPVAGEMVVTSYDSLPAWLEPPTHNIKTESKAAYWARYKVWMDSLKDQHPEINGLVLVGDEFHKCKNYKAKRSKQFKTLSNVTTSLGGKVWILTGTPLDNRPEDLYGMLDAANMAFDVFTPNKGQSPLARFRELFNAESDRFGTRYNDPSPIVPELLRRVMLRRRRAEVLPDLPGKTYSTITVGDIDSSVRKQLDEMWNDIGTQLEVEESLPPFEKFSEMRKKLAESRIPAMLDYVEECEEQDVPLVIFTSHLAPTDALLGRPGWAVISGATSPEKRAEIVAAFQAGRLKGVACTIRAAGVGLTLTHAWKALFVDLDWVPGWNAQAEDRICRIGQLSKKVEIVRMVSDHPLDLHVLNLLSAKIALIDKAIERAYTPTVATAQAGPNSEGETEEEFQARIAAMEKAMKDLENKKEEDSAAAKKAKAKSKVSLIHNREKGKATIVLPLTPARESAVREAFKYMLGVCDGAVMKDGQGFNRPDAAVAHCLLTAGLETREELEAGQYLTTRYKRQLGTKWPILFQEAA